MVCEPESPEFLALTRFEPDTCVCLNVLEHIEDDLAALRSMASILRPGGVIVLLVPAFPALYGPIDRNLAHYRRYTARSLKRLAAAAALDCVKLRYMNAAGFFGWWANARLFHRERQSQAQIAIFDRYVVPVASPVEALLPPPFGQSLIAILRKR